MIDMKAIKDILATIHAKDNKPQPYDTTAEVVRVEGTTAWVHIPGGVDETPAAMTIAASVGDTVRVRVSGGQAYLIGSDSAPPTDDTTAIYARTVATDANKAAQTAAADAEEALTTANGVAGTAAAAQADAATAKNIATDMNQYFWHQSEAVYFVSADTEVDTSKTYYEYDATTEAYTAVMPAGSESPAEQGWYERFSDNGAHVTEMPQDEFIKEPQGGNTLITSHGLALRDGLTEISSFSADGVLLGAKTQNRAFLSSGSLIFYDVNGYEIGSMKTSEEDSEPLMVTDILEEPIRISDEIATYTYELKEKPPATCTYFLLNFYDVFNTSSGSGMKYDIGYIFPNSGIEFEIEYEFPIIKYRTLNTKYDGNKTITFTVTESTTYPNGVPVLHEEKTIAELVGAASDNPYLGRTVGSGSGSSSYYNELWLINIDFLYANFTPSYYTFGSRADIIHSGAYSAVLGEGLIAQHANKVSIGRYNKQDFNNEYVFQVGNGHLDDLGETELPEGSGNTFNFYDVERSDAFAVGWNGDTYQQGSAYLDKKGKGLYGIDTAGNVVPLIRDNGTNLWIGASATAAKHHVGGTYISSGYDGSAGKKTIYVSVPNANNDNATNYGVYHTGNKPTYSDVGAAAASHTHPYLPLSGGTLTGNLTVNSDSARVALTNSSGLSGMVGTNGDGDRFGVWSNDLSKWLLLYDKTNAAVRVNGLDFTTAAAARSSLGVNNTVTNIAPSAVSVATATDTTLGNTGSLAAGTYIITCSAQFAAKSGGWRKIYLATSTTGGVTNRTAQTATSVSTADDIFINFTYIVTITSATTFYLRARHSAGSNISVTPAIRILKIHD